MVECCAEKTYAATTIADIVSRASISRTTFYKRFAGKRECFDAALDWCIEQLRTAAARAHCPSDSPAEAVRKAAAAILELMAAQARPGAAGDGRSGRGRAGGGRALPQAADPGLGRPLGRPGEPRRSHADPRLAFGRAQVLIFNQIAAGRTEQLPELLPGNRLHRRCSPSPATTRR